ncbi:hypothetical protein [Vallitalea okinawensis]|uniref:hypothetical protein n=1 Tax=Vallitalea okinawensis TaxID=2078660 RepID=UPI000CFCBDBA|nr:hypothetical protein [Vallitalea okinawensis]
MGTSLSKIIAWIIACFLMFIFPLMNMFESQDEIARIYILSKTTEFADSTRNLGYITRTMYENYVNAISATNNLYTVELQHYHKKINPVYEEPSIKSSFKNTFQVNYDAYFTKEILDELYDHSSGYKYTFREGDYFVIKVKNINKTTGTRIQELMIGAELPTEKVVITYGGMIKNENY